MYLSKYCISLNYKFDPQNLSILNMIKRVQWPRNKW